MTFDIKEKYAPKAGSIIRPDGWELSSRLIDDDFYPFRLLTQSRGPITSLAVNVEITGRTFRWREDRHCIRVKITFIGDGEPDNVCRGWMYL